MSFPLIRYITKILRSYKEYRREIIPPQVLPIAQHKYVETIYKSPGITQEKLSDEFVVDKSTIARQLQQMEENGLIKREPLADDKRYRGVYPTQKLMELEPLIKKARCDYSKKLVEILSPEEQEELEHLLKKISEHIEEEGNHIQ